MYHSVSNIPCEKDIPYDNVSPKLFENHMKILVSGGYSVISLDALTKAIAAKQNIPPPKPSSLPLMMDTRIIISMHSPY